MAFLLNSQSIRAPKKLEERNSSQMAQQRTIDGSVARDYFGSNKRVWSLSYDIAKKSDYDTIYTIYSNYLTNSTPVSWQVTETNYTVSATTVHVDLEARNFSVKGTDYLSEFTLVLTEA